MQPCPVVSFQFGFVALAVWSVLIDLAFAICPCNTPAPEGKEVEQAKPKFDSENYLTGDWFGLRNTLYDHGVEITGGYTTEPAGNPIGGLEHGATYLHNFGFGIQLDLNKLFTI